MSEERKGHPPADWLMTDPDGNVINYEEWLVEYTKRRDFDSFDLHGEFLLDVMFQGITTPDRKLLPWQTVLIGFQNPFDPRIPTLSIVKSFETHVEAVAEFKRLKEVLIRQETHPEAFRAELMGKLAKMLQRRLLQQSVLSLADKVAAVGVKIDEVSAAFEKLATSTQAYVRYPAQKWYNRKGEVITALEYERLRGGFEKNFRVAMTAFEFTREGVKAEIFISTVFLGLDHNFTGRGEPILFETLVRIKKSTGEVADSDLVRYTTEAEAQKGHRQIVDEISEIIREKGEISSRGVGQITAGRARQQDRAHAQDGEEEIH